MNEEIYQAMYGTMDKSKGDVFYTFLPQDQRANMCVACLECEEKCPQHIEISQWLPRVHEALAGD